jgi:hypothetical protein
VLDYENALKFHNERTEVIEGEFGDWKSYDID